LLVLPATQIMLVVPYQKPDCETVLSQEILEMNKTKCTLSSVVASIGLVVFFFGTSSALAQSHPFWDTDGDARSDVAVWRTGSGVWYTMPSNSPGTYTTNAWGVSSDIPVPGDYDGDGKSDLAVWRPSNGTWYIRPSGAPGTYTAKAWGVSSDVPMPGDYDGDGKADDAVWRPSNGIWYVRPSGSPGSYTTTGWGANTDIPVSSDYDGDGKADIAVFRPGTGTWYMRKSSVPGTYISMKWGASSDIPVPGDYDADGKADVSVWRPSNGVWYIRPSTTTGYTTTSWGTNEDIPVSGDFDGDGKADIAVWRPSNGTWYIRPSGTPGTFTTSKWGVAGDLPVSAITRIVSVATAARPALLSKTETPIAATSNVVQNETLPLGFKLTGTISGPGQGIAVVASAGPGNVFAGSVDQATGKYLIVLPSGTYTLQVSFSPNGVPSGQNMSVASSVSGSVTVSGNTTRDITLPAVSLFTVSGAVNGLSNLPSATGMQILFSSSDNSILAEFGLAVDGSYDGVLPAANYTAGITAAIAFPPSLFQNQELGILNLGAANISSNTVIPAFTVPATAKLSGTVFEPPLIGVRITAIGPSSSIVSSSSADMLTGQYQMILPDNTTYGVNLSILLTDGENPLGGEITFPVPASSLNFAGDTANYDFTVPTLPVRVTISGHVVDGNGNSVSGATISATSQSITDTPNLQFSHFAQTDASGNYSLSVLSGTNYQLVFTPPIPAQ
jgi:hypothetical protein